MEDLETEALMEEYRSLRSEVGQRVQNQLVVLGGNIALAIGAFPLLAPEFGQSDYFTLLLSPLVFFIVAWIYFEQDVFLTQAATYLHQSLRPTILTRISTHGKLQLRAETVLGWEEYRHQVLFKDVQNLIFLNLMTFFRLLATLGPAIIILLGVIWQGVISRGNSRQHLNSFEYILLVVDVIVLILLVYLSIHVLRLYRSIAPAHPSHTPPKRSLGVGEKQLARDEPVEQ